MLITKANPQIPNCGDNSFAISFEKYNFIVSLYVRIKTKTKDPTM